MRQPPVGNRTASHLSATYGYQPFNKLTSTASATYIYDNNGNLTSKTDASGTTTYTFNEENQLTKVTLPGGLTVNYKYDGLGRRIQRTTSAGADERYVYDGRDVLIDLNADWSVANTYLNAPAVDKHLRQTNATTGTSYLLTDHLGSTSALTDVSGNVIQQFVYDSFGNNSGSTRSRYGYTGRERDPDTGMLYYRARFYDPQVGRFIETDPVGFNGRDVNLYGYVWNSPVNYRDPLGLDGWGNDAADWLDRRIETARKFYEPNPDAVNWNTGINFGSNSLHGIADSLRVGSGVGDLIYGPPDNGYGIAANILRDVSRASIIFSLIGGPAARFAGGAAPIEEPLECECQTWPDTAEEMDQRLGIEGERIPDPLGKEGRAKVVWRPSEQIKITYERHPYHPNAPSWHRGPHWHLDSPGCRPHVRFLAGEPLP